MKLLNSKEIKYKEYLKLLKRLDKLDIELRKLPNIKLNKPYQSGWIILYDLRDDIKRRQDYSDIKKCLDLGWHQSYTKNVNIVRAIRKGDTKSFIKSKYGSLYLISDYLPYRRNISEEDYFKLDNKTNKYYILDTTSDNYIKYKRKRWYCDFPNYWLVLKVKPNIITHKRLKGGELQSEYDYIRNKIYNSKEFNSFITNYDKFYPKSKDRVKIRCIIRKFINGDIEDIFNDKIPLKYKY